MYLIQRLKQNRGLGLRLENVEGESSSTSITELQFTTTYVL
jgi:hypothetical protein